MLALLYAIFDSDSKSSDSTFPFDTNRFEESYNSAHVSFVLCSENLGVTDSYSACEYYRDHFNEDVIRVGTLLERAHEWGWNLFQSINPTVSDISSSVHHKKVCFDMSTLFHFIARSDCVAIALVDQSLWTPICSTYTENCHEASGTSSKIHPLFIGHYILICGISCDNEDLQKAKQDNHGSSLYPYCLMIRDPSIQDNIEINDHPFMFVCVERFEKCWKSIGTDSDIILISVQNIKD